jgi:cytoskeletal protein CcmA (bactofilin family)
MFLARKEPEPAPPPTKGPPLSGSAATTAPSAVVDLPRKPGDPLSAPAGASRLAADHGPADGKRLIVGEGISLSGEITACDRLVVEGSVKVTLNQTRAIEIAESGRFTEGKAEVEDAEISGVYEGELTVRKRLLIRHTGRVKGTVRYGEIEKGGVLSGSVSMLEPAKA